MVHFLLCGDSASDGYHSARRKIKRCVKIPDTCQYQRVSATRKHNIVTHKFLASLITESDLTEGTFPKSFAHSSRIFSKRPA